MKNFYLTFCFKNPLRRSYVRIEARDYDDAYMKAYAHFKMDWRLLLSEEKFNADDYPNGEHMLLY